MSSRAEVERTLLFRVADLEARVEYLERVLRRSKEAERAKAKKAGAPRGPARRRCPGCTLELPVGRAGKTCVWCGFRFDAVAPLPPMRRRV